MDTGGCLTSNTPFPPGSKFPKPQDAEQGTPGS